MWSKVYGGSHSLGTQLSLNVATVPSASHLNVPHHAARADILIVEDDAEQLQFLTQVLTSQNYQVRIARDANSALCAIHMIRPDLILMDVNLPDSDGFTLCQTLQAEPQLSEVPVIFLSGMADSHSQVKGFQAGGRDYITKPFEEAVIKVRIENQLQLRQLQQRQTDFILLQERHRIARELHDSVNQSLFIMGATIDMLRKFESGLSMYAQDQLDFVRQISQSMIDDMRTLLYELQPETFQQARLEELLDHLLQSLTPRASARLHLNVQRTENSLEGNLSRKSALYRIAREALFNALKHS